MIAVALKVANRLERDGVIERYAISGGIAVMYYAQPRETHDLDVMVLVSSDRRGTLKRIYGILREAGYRRHDDYVKIDGIDVQFFPVSGGLDAESVVRSRRVTILGVATRVIRPEYLLAMKLHLGRPQDIADVQRLWDQARLNQRLLARILAEYGLRKKWHEFLRRFYV